MPPKDIKKGQKTALTGSTQDTLSLYGEFDYAFVSPRFVSLSLQLKTETSVLGDWIFLAIFNGQIILEGKWQDGMTLETDSMPINLKEPRSQALIADVPLVFLLRLAFGKSAKDPDPLLNSDNRAGATIDLLPLVLGEQLIQLKVPLLWCDTGGKSNYAVMVRCCTRGISDNTKNPLLLTMISVHCLPAAKEGTVYLGAIGIDGVVDPMVVNFGMSLSNVTAHKIVWATASSAGQAANTMINIPQDDRFIPQTFEPRTTEHCRSFYWNAMKRVLVDPDLLRTRLLSPMFVEIAGVPRFGKIDLRGRYMGYLDARALLEPGQLGVTICANLLFYNEIELPENVGPLLDIPPSSAKVSARDTGCTMDEFGHNAYVVLRLDLMEPLIPKTKIAFLYETIGFPPPENSAAPINELDIEPLPEDTTLDVRRIRKEGAALAVHKELSGLACRGSIPMNQSIKRTAANHLLLRIRSMLKHFPAGECSDIDLQGIITGQHAASRRAVTFSFSPQPPLLRLPARSAAARCRVAGDKRIPDKHIESNIEVAGCHTRSLFSKVLRCLEERKDLDAKNYGIEALSAQPRNRYLLWIFGGQEYDKGAEASEMAVSAFKIAVTGDYSDGIANAIGWAALHGLYHYKNNEHAAFIAAKNMRNSYELLREWKQFLKRWIDDTGEEETFWIPGVIANDNPIVVAAAFFLCLRCFNFSENLLKCAETGCATRGSRYGSKFELNSDIYYIRSASLILRGNFDQALEMTQNGIQRFGPSAIMSQMRASCLLYAKGCWDADCESALSEADKAGADLCPRILLQAALGSFKIDPKSALQLAARAHKIAPCAHSAHIISRIYLKMHEESFAERWASVAVKIEPLLADAWAVLAVLAMKQRNLDKARTLLRTARQVGPLSDDIDEEVNKLMNKVQLETLPDSMVKKMCLCKYY